MSDNDDTLPLDEQDEFYGYGILNVHKNQFVSPLGNGGPGDGSDLFTDEDELEGFYETLAEEQDSVQHLRIVAVNLDNEMDKQVIESTDGE